MEEKELREQQDKKTGPSISIKNDEEEIQREKRDIQLTKELDEKLEQGDVEDLPKREFQFYDERLINEIEEEEREKIKEEEETRREQEEWVDLLGSGDLMKKMIKPGTSGRPSLGDKVTLCYSVKYGEEIVEHKEEFSFILGEGEAPQAFDLGVGLMDVGEVSLIKSKSRFAYGAKGKKPDIPSNADVEFEVELTGHQPLSDRKEMTIPERIEYMSHKRLVGNRFYEEGDSFEEAANCYLKAVKCANLATDVEGNEQFKNFQDIHAKCLNNLITCQIKLDEYQEALKNCDQLLKIEPSNAKGLFKKGKLLSYMNEHDRAIELLTKVVTLEPNDRVVREELKKAKQKRFDHQKKEKSIFSSMINSFESHPEISDSLTESDLTNTKKSRSSSPRSSPKSSPETSPVTSRDSIESTVKKVMKQIETNKPPPFYNTYIFRILIVSILLAAIAILIRVAGFAPMFDNFGGTGINEPQDQF